MEHYKVLAKIRLFCGDWLVLSAGLVMMVIVVAVVLPERHWSHGWEVAGRNEILVGHNYCVADIQHCVYSIILVVASWMH